MTGTGWTSAQIEAAQDRYLSDLEAILLESVDRERRRVVLLSGGTDSFLIVAALRHILPRDELYTVTIKGLQTDDLAAANDAARHFCTKHRVCEISIDDIMENLHIIAGAGHRTLRPAMSHICFWKDYGSVSDSAVEIARWLSAPR